MINDEYRNVYVRSKHLCLMVLNKSASINSVNNPLMKDFLKLEKQFDNLTRNQARSIEQYYIENDTNELNKIFSISKKSKYYEEAINWASNYIRR